MRREVELVIQHSKIDEAKLPEAMDIIERAAAIMEEMDWDEESEQREELLLLQNRLRELTGKKDFDIEEVNEYWSYTSLETKAEQALMQETQKYGLSDEALRELIEEIIKSGDLEKESTNDFWMEFLELETGIEDVMDFFYSVDDKGGIGYISVDEIMEQIRQERAQRQYPADSGVVKNERV